MTVLPVSPDALAGFDARLAVAPPAACAVVADGVGITYAELDRASAAHAAALRAVEVPPGAPDGYAGRVGPESVVAIVAERGPAYVAMVLGVLRAGAAFMPVEPATPVPRAQRMCRTANVRALLVQPGHEAYAAEVAGAGRPTVLAAAGGGAPGAVPEVPPRARDGLAYVIFTSGSTGSPKGAMVTDGGMVNHLAAKRHDLALGAADVIGLTAPLSFDISVWQTLLAATVGGRVAVASPANLAEPAELVAWVARHGVTVLEIVPSFLAVLVDELTEDAGLRAGLGTLRHLVATGEALPARLARRWYDCCPDIPVVNAYGPTECSDDVTHHMVTREECATRAFPPIGAEIQDTRLYVVDAGGTPVGADVEGDLLVGGAGVGRGYIADPVRTALAFVPDHLSGRAGARLYRTGDRGSRAPDGTYDYHGRRDRQVKIRGHRVELGDVEAQLLAVPGVATAASVFADGRLRAFVTPGRTSAGAGVLDADDVLRAVRASAPAYLVPHEVTVLDRLPTGRAGKVDHRALAERAAVGAAERAAAPARADRPEPTLAQARAVFAEVLAAPAAGDDDFFALGGDSLLAMRLVSLARKRFDAEGASLRGFLTDPTPRGLLAVLRAAGEAEHPAEHAELLPGALSSGQERLWFLEQLHPGRDPLVIRLRLTLRGSLDTAALRHALNAVVARHEPLRTVFAQVAGVPAGTVWPTAEITLDEVPASEVDPGAPSGLSVHTARPPLMTARLARVAPDHHVLLLVLHHLVADGWSIAVLSEEIATYYRRHLAGDRAVPPPETTYAHYVAEERRWLAGPDGEACERYWAGALEGAEPVIELPLSRPRRTRPDFTAHHVVRELTEWETDAVAQVARAARATPFMAVTAAFYAVLRGLCGTDDLVLGIDSLNRSWPGSEGLIGTFVNQLPVRLTLPAGGEPTFDELLALVRGRCLDAYEHDRLPFHRIVAAVNPPRRAGRFPLFQVKVTQQSGWK
ncbi:amino acid adenylation domain-containing protein, partial [Actinophytocola sp.]|uniref:amino acid adenylation domain-containing protein n=1 Tax=Actinophytocola sp. TaxID=1872138 RepID=UPI002D755A11